MVRRLVRNTEHLHTDWNRWPWSALMVQRLGEDCVSFRQRSFATFLYSRCQDRVK